ncbi:hypothetical protein P7K49_033219 [Saguinus oedipus]|uniref:MHC class I antigen n=1 Tax=Saguinus oedipus TaxID=9490 RepID=A0ABQ9TRA7_SAGOE|nr:hypothetical protein P7K49_033219 [Saguinus oedipus]
MENRRGLGQPRAGLCLLLAALQLLPGTQAEGEGVRAVCGPVSDFGRFVGARRGGAGRDAGRGGAGSALTHAQLLASGWAP